MAIPPLRTRPKGVKPLVNDTYISLRVDTLSLPVDWLALRRRGFLALGSLSGASLGSSLPDHP